MHNELEDYHRQRQTVFYPKADLPLPDALLQPRAEVQAAQQRRCTRLGHLEFRSDVGDRQPFAHIREQFEQFDYALSGFYHRAAEFRACIDKHETGIDRTLAWHCSIGSDLDVLVFAPEFRL